MKYEDLEFLMVLTPLRGKRTPNLYGTFYIGTEWDDKLHAQVFNFHDRHLHLKTSLVFKNGELFTSCAYGDTLSLSDFDCSFQPTAW